MTPIDPPNQPPRAWHIGAVLEMGFRSLAREAAEAVWLVSYELALRLGLTEDQAAACAADAYASALDEDQRSRSVGFEMSRGE